MDRSSTAHLRSNILVFSNSWKEHLHHVRDEVLLSLRRNGLTAKLMKCVWGAKELEYLGHKDGGGKVCVRKQGLRQ